MFNSHSNPPQTVNYGSSNLTLHFICIIFRAPSVPAILDDDLVLKIGEVHGKTPAQILLRHLMQQNIVVVPKSASQKRIKENLDVYSYASTLFLKKKKTYHHAKARKPFLI